MRAKAATTQSLFTGAARGYDRLSQTLSLGQYRRWHARLAERARAHGLGRGDDVLDVATGTGLIAEDLVAATGCRVVGLDLTRAMLVAGTRRRDAMGARHRGLLQGDAQRLPFRDEAFQGLTFSYLYRYVEDPAAVTRELARVVAPRGFVGMVEFHVPPAPVWRGLWKIHTRVGLPAAGALAGPGWYRVGRFLGPSIERLYAAHDTASLARIWRESGLVDVRVEPMSLGGGLVMTARKEG